MAFKFFNNRKRLTDKFLGEQELGSPLVTFFKSNSNYAEEFRTLRVNLDFAQVDQNISNFLVTSSIPAEGKSTIAANLAYTIAQTDKKVLIVDTDLRKPTLHRTFRLSNDSGLTTLLSNPNGEVGDYILRSPELKLSFLTSGPKPPNPAELLQSARMTKVMNELKSYYDVIIYDCAPLNSVSDSQIMASKVEGVVLVVRPGYVERPEVRRAIESLKNVDANILGYVNNGLGSDREGYYGYNYGYTSEE